MLISNKIRVKNSGLFSFAQLYIKLAISSWLSQYKERFHLAMSTYSHLFCVHPLSHNYLTELS